MNRVVITGKNGYIATSLRERFERENVCVTVLDMRDENWQNVALCGADALIHTAALVHQSEKEHTLAEYRRINTEMTLALARIARDAGIERFIYFSSMAVYGSPTALSCFKKKEINEKTQPMPKSNYAISKYEAEQGLLGLETGTFKAAIVRPPFVYGSGCPGNYAQLKKLTLKTGLIPKLNNRKSMIYIENLAEFVWQLYKTGASGTFMPQNSEMKSTWELAALIAENNGKKALCSGSLALPVYFGSLFIKKLRTAFGSEYYAPKLSGLSGIEYNIVDFAESVRLSEQPLPQQSVRA